MASAQNDVREIIDAISTMKEQTKTLENIIRDGIKSSYNINPGIMDALLPYTMDDIKNFDEPKCREIISEFADLNNISNIISSTIEDNEDVKNENDALHYILNDIKDSSLRILSSKMEVKKIETESEKLFEEVITSYNSPESIEERKNNLIQLKLDIDNETDEDKRYEIQKKYDILSKAFSLDFFTERLRSLGEKEVTSIVNSFFNDQKGAYVIDRFKRTMRRINKVNPEIYKNYFNIEQYFCGEEYYKYNNLFLFIYMRFIGRCSPYDKRDVIYAQAITSAISNLMYHRFGDAKYESDMINLVKSVDDYFINYAEKFEKENLMNPLHPINIESTKKINNERKEKIKVAFNRFNIHIDDFDTKTPEELQKILNDEIESIIEKQVTEFNENQKDETDLNVEDDSDIKELKSEEDFNDVLGSVPDTERSEIDNSVDSISDPLIPEMNNIQIKDSETNEYMDLNLPGLHFIVNEEDKQLN